MKSHVWETWEIFLSGRNLWVLRRVSCKGSLERFDVALAWKLLNLRLRCSRHDCSSLRTRCHKRTLLANLCHLSHSVQVCPCVVKSLFLLNCAAYVMRSSSLGTSVWTDSKLNFILANVNFQFSAIFNGFYLN
jgi:hypothetical protein